MRVLQAAPAAYPYRSAAQKSARWQLRRGSTRGEAVKENKTQKLLNDVLAQIAEILFASIVSDTEGRLWKQAVLDVRGAPGGDARLQKWRVQLADGEMLSELDTPIDATPLLTKAFDLRGEGSAEKKWWGLLIAVFPDKRTEVKFDYDPNCVSTFFDS
jgi:hypothetical protein